MLKDELTAALFIEKLCHHQSNEELKKIKRYFKSDVSNYGEKDVFIGVKMGLVFQTAKEFIEMPIDEIEKLLESPIHEIRAGAVSIMDKASRDKKITKNRLQDLFNLYIRRHDRINNWDLVDLGCLNMTGSYLIDQPRSILYELAKSAKIWERRTAILATCYFIKKGDLNDTYQIAEILLKDEEDLVHKGVGWMLRFAGDKSPERLLHFLDQYASTMPRTMLRYSIEKLEPSKRAYYLGLKKLKID